MNIKTAKKVRPSETRVFHLSLLCLLLVLAGVGTDTSGARADSVSQIATGVRISPTTAKFIDPQGVLRDSVDGTDTLVHPGDILTFVAHFTPIPNGGVRGLGGYVTVVVVTMFAPDEIVGIAYDSGGVTTSTITVPLVTA